MASPASPTPCSEPGEMSRAAGTARSSSGRPRAPCWRKKVTKLFHGSLGLICGHKPMIDPSVHGKKLYHVILGVVVKVYSDNIVKHGHTEAVNHGRCWSDSCWNYWPHHHSQGELVVSTSGYLHPPPLLSPCPLALPLICSLLTSPLPPGCQSYITQSPG